VKQLCKGREHDKLYYGEKRGGVNKIGKKRKVLGLDADIWDRLERKEQGRAQNGQLLARAGVSRKAKTSSDWEESLVWKKICLFDHLEAERGSK